MTRDEFAALLGIKKSYFNRMILHGNVRKDKARKFAEITGIDVKVFLYESGKDIRKNLEFLYGEIPETRGCTATVKWRNAERNERIFFLFDGGLSVIEIADREGITRERVYQILRTREKE